MKMNYVEGLINNVLIYHTLSLFFIYSILGWIIESLSISKQEKKFINRGVLNSPICPIYGVVIASINLICSLDFYSINNVLFLFIISLLIIIIFWYSTTILLEKLFKIKLWDYSHKHYNINGRISLKKSVIFAALTVIIIKYVNPTILNEISLMPQQMLKLIVIVFLAVLLVDCIISFLSFVNLNTRIEKMYLLKNQIKVQAESNTAFNEPNEMFFFLNKRYDDLIKEIRAQIENNSFEHLFLTKERFIEKFEFLNKKYIEVRSKKNGLYKRILTAYPDIKSLTNDDALNELLEYIHFN